MRLSYFTLAGLLATALALPVMAEDPTAEASTPLATATPAITIVEAPDAPATAEAPAPDTANAERAPAEEAEAMPVEQAKAMPAPEVEAAAAAAVEESPSAETATASTEDAAEPSGDASASGVEQLGPVGYDVKGRAGRIHEVALGDTLWDVSDAYLGTPWVWPSIWKDNDDIENPHLIHPGDKIWVSPYEMRRVTDAEADMLLSGTPGDFPAALGDGMDMGGPREVYRFTWNQTTGFVTAEELAGSGSIVEALVPRIMLSDSTPVVIGFGEGEVSVGDRFEIFRPSDRVPDLDSGLLIGHSTLELGWLEVTEVHDDTATAIIRMSTDDIMRGDHIQPRVAPPSEIPVLAKPDVEGRILFTPNKRSEMAEHDIVYLDRGTEDGLAVGSPLEIYEELGEGEDKVRERTVGLPDLVIAKLIVVDAGPENAVAIVTHSTHEIGRGDHFRGSDSIAP
jgi:hypothetical protein